MIRSVLFVVAIAIVNVVYAQDLSNKGLINIKDQSEALRMSWLKSFDEAVQTKDFSSLAFPRQESETFLTKHLSAIRRQMAEGDGRALLTAVGNYLQIEKQFVKDVMIAAESLTGANREGIDKTYQKINDFGQKEKSFLVDINNALATEKEDIAPSAASDVQIDTDEDYEEPKGSVVEETRKRKKGKLPHEQERKKSKKSSEEEEE